MEKALGTLELATLEEDVLTSIIDRLRLQNALLQEKVDREGYDVLRSIFVSSIDKAREAADFYNLEWFENCLYSDGIKNKIATKLINDCKVYPVDNSSWVMIVNPQDVDVEGNME